MEERLKLINLLDFYGALLTEKQRQCIEMYLFEDLSYSEIAETMDISRQAVYDIVHRVGQILVNYENCLGLVARYKGLEMVLSDISKEVLVLKTDNNTEIIDRILEKLSPFLDNREV